MTEKTDTQVTTPGDLELSDPSALVTGQPMPFKDVVFRTPDGTRIKVRLQGLTYAVKSKLDAEARIKREEAERTGVVQSDLRGPMLIACAARKPNGQRAFATYEDQINFAIQLMDQCADGEISRGYNTVLELSGYGEDAVEEAGKD